jgi:hypothetical protein
VPVNGVNLFNVLLLFKDIFKKSWTYNFNVRGCKYIRILVGESSWKIE